MLKAGDIGIPTRTGCACTTPHCAHHRAIRALWKPYVEAGIVDCWRCGKRLPPDKPWDLGHVDGALHEYEGPECWADNRSTSTRRKEKERWTL